MASRALILALVTGGCRIDFDVHAGTSDAADGAMPSDVPSDVAIDAAIDAAIMPNLVFVTSTMLAPSSGLAAIDALCAQRATAAHLPGAYVAFVSTSTQSARQRLAGSRGWVRVDGLPVLDQVSDFDDMTLPRPILLDESGTARGEDFVMTGSSETGNGTANTCADWTATSGPLFCGEADQTYPALVSFGDGGCGTLYPVYCFGTGRVATVDVRAATHSGRILFTSEAVFAPNAGIAAADARCQTDATAANLPGTYRAMLATQTQSIADHVGGVAGAWQRPDGISITTTGLDQPPLQSVLNITASQQFYDGTSYLGAMTLTSTASLNCSDWSITTGDAQVALNYTARPFTETSQFVSGCASPARLLCAQL